MVWREGTDVRLYTRNGHDWAHHFPGIVAAARALKAECFLIDGEVLVAGSDGRGCPEATLLLVIKLFLRPERCLLAIWADYARLLFADRDAESSTAAFIDV